MERKLIRSGNGWAVFIPLTILKLLKIDPKIDRIEFEIENQVLKIKKAEHSKED